MSVVGHSRRFKLGQILQLGQMLHSVVSDCFTLTKIELGHILQLGQILHSVVSEVGADTKIEPGSILQLGQNLHPVVSGHNPETSRHTFSHFGPSQHSLRLLRETSLGQTLAATGLTRVGMSPLAFPEPKH